MAITPTVELALYKWAMSGPYFAARKWDRCLSDAHAHFEEYSTYDIDLATFNGWLKRIGAGGGLSASNPDWWEIDLRPFAASGCKCAGRAAVA